MSTMTTAAATDATINAMEKAEFAALPTEKQTLLQIIWAKAQQAGAQIAAIVVRFVRWAKNGITQLSNSPMTVGSVVATAIAASERGYHGLVSIIEAGVDALGTAFHYIDKAVSTVVSVVNDGFIWLLNKISPKAATKWSEMTLAFTIGKQALYTEIAERVSIGILTLRTTVARKYTAGVAILFGSLVVANTATGGFLASITPAAIAGTGAVTLFTPLGALTMIAAAMLGLFMGGFIFKRVDHSAVECNPIQPSRKAEEAAKAAEELAEAAKQATAEPKAAAAK